MELIAAACLLCILLWAIWRWPDRLAQVRQITSAELAKIPSSTAAMVLTPFAVRQSYRPERIAAHRDEDGAPVMRFEVQCLDPDVKKGARSEVRFQPNLFHHPLRFDIAIRIPSDWQPSPTEVIALQWHGTRDFWAGEGARIPPLALSIRDDMWCLKGAWDQRWHSGFWRRAHVQGTHDIWRGDIRPGVWEHFEVEIQWAIDHRGDITMYRNGTRVCQHCGPNSYNDTFGPYLKFGVYVPQWSKCRADPGMLQREARQYASRQLDYRFVRIHNPDALAQSI